MHVPLPCHQEELSLREVGVHQGQRHAVEGQVPGRVPRELPLVRHGDDVAVDHVVPVAVADRAPLGGRRRAAGVAFEEGVDVVVVELLAPDHAGQRLALDPLAVLRVHVLLQYLVEGVRLFLAHRADGVEARKGLRDVCLAQPQAPRGLAAGRHCLLGVEASLRASLAGLGGRLSLENVATEGVPVRARGLAARGVVHGAPAPLRRCEAALRVEGAVDLLPCLLRDLAEVGALPGLGGVAREVEGPQPSIITRERGAVGLVLADEDLGALLAEEVHLAELGVLDADLFRAGALHLRLVGLLVPRPRVAEVGLRHHVQLRGLGPAVDGRDAHEDVVLTLTGVLDEDIEVPVVVEDASVHQLVLTVVVTEAGVDPAHLVVWELLLGVLVQHLEVAVRGRGVQVVVHVLDILAVVSLRATKSKHALLQDRVHTVPHADRETHELLEIAETGDAILAPAVRDLMRLVEAEVGPRVAVRAVVLTARAPLPLADVGPPLLPIGLAAVAVGHAYVLLRLRLQFGRVQQAAAAEAHHGAERVARHRAGRGAGPRSALSVGDARPPGHTGL
mmetsp:Transcript_25159/g.63828  ORF Transcript_25159/g.63828 Transcript_25159/m.63828 type:complete len:562 (+) Transcript_25159:1435-3120(+)